VGLEGMRLIHGDGPTVYHAREFRAQSGVHFTIWRSLGLGPYGLASVGQYRFLSSSRGRSGVSADERTYHLWLSLGAQLSFVM
jgi:hypothetical protein